MVSNISVLRTILQLAAENQIKESEVYPIAITPQGAVVELPTFQSLEEYLNQMMVFPWAPPARDW